MVYLEEGRLPIKGEVCLKTFLWNPQATTDNNNNNNDDDGYDDDDDDDDDESRLSAMTSRRRSMLVELPPLCAPSDWTLSQLKSRVLELIQSQIEMEVVGGPIASVSGRWVL